MSEDESLIENRQQLARDQVAALTGSWTRPGVHALADLVEQHDHRTLREAVAHRLAELDLPRRPVWIVGMPRTGTTSLLQAVKMLGWTPIGCPRHWDQLEGRNAASDVLVCAHWRELRDLEPDSLFILTTRDFESWTRSLQAIRGFWDSQLWWDRYYRERVYGTHCLDDVDGLRRAWDRHHAEVRAGLPPERLLELPQPFEWEPLCRFLEVAVPPQPFPRTNSSALRQHQGKA